jgi:hypothetical protein
MLLPVMTILLFGVLGYSFAKSKPARRSTRFDIALVVLLVLAANLHGIGFFGVGDYRMYVNEMLEGFIAGYLIGRMLVKAV